MRYRLIQEVNGMAIKTEFNEENVIAAMEARGFALDGLNRNPRQREELQDQPKFKGLAGPMWDGDTVRYEDWKTYERLSV